MPLIARPVRARVISVDGLSLMLHRYPFRPLEPQIYRIESWLERVYAPRPTIKLERRFRLHVMGNLDRQVLKDSKHVGGRAIIIPML